LLCGSGKDVSASYNLGRLISKRMLEAGITEVFYDRQLARTTDTDRDSLNSEKVNYAGCSFICFSYYAPFKEEGPYCFANVGRSLRPSVGR